jgi:membrane protein
VVFLSKAEMRFLSNLPNLLKLTYQGWKEDRASRLAAALAYYTIFSLAPMLVIVIAVAGLIWQREAVQLSVMNQVQGLVGAQGAEFVSGLLTSASNPAEGIAATIIGIITLLFGALGVFNELHNALNTIWEVKEEKTEGFWNSVKKVIVDRFLSFTMILGIGFMLLVSLVISAGISATEELLASVLPFHELILQLINLVISIGVITVFFALIFKYLPDADIAWRDVWVGAFFTAVFFSLGKTLIGLYLGSSAIASSYGAAGSLVLLLVWIYYSAQILFFGAEFTQVYANQFGSKIVPEGQAATTPPGSTSTGARNTGRQIIPVTSAPIFEMNPKIERENQQTARFIFGLMSASFITGIMTTIFGFKKKRK